jgi:hypothetical protein
MINTMPGKPIKSPTTNATENNAGAHGPIASSHAATSFEVSPPRRNKITAVAMKAEPSTAIAAHRSARRRLGLVVDKSLK